MASSTNINNDTLVELEKVRYLSEDVFRKENERTRASAGDILFTSVGSLGRSCIFDGSVNICFQRSVSVLSTMLFNQYLKYFFDSGYFQQKIVKEATGTAQKGFYLNQLAVSLIPVPPLAEQRRIVAKIEQILPHIKRYELSESRIIQLNADFPEQLKKSILQEAVQGKLVPQDPSDEPASALLERIREEKARLIKEGKIKKNKNESVIFRRDNSYYEKLNGIERCIDNELPFEIPNNWIWARIGNLFSLQAGKNITASEIKNNLFDGAFPCYGGNDLRGYVDRYNKEGDYPIIGRQGALCGNIKRATGKFYATEHAVCVSTYMGTDVEWACLFLEALNLNQYATATAQPGLAVSKINEIMIPVPPLKEQKRICQKYRICLKTISELL